MKKDVWAAGDLYEPYVGRWSRVVAREFLEWLELPERKHWLNVAEARALDEGVRFPLCHPTPLTALFREAGLSDVEVRPIDAPTPFRDFDDYWAAKGRVPTAAA